MRLLYITHKTKDRLFYRVENLATRITARGYQITILCISNKACKDIVEYNHNGIHYVETPDLLRGRLRSGWDLWDTYKRIVWLSANNDYDLIHAFEARPVTIYPILWLSKRKRMPLVIDWIDWWGRGGLITVNRPKYYSFLFGGIETYFEERFRTIADVTTVISSALGERAESLGVIPSSIFKIPIGADTDSIPYVDRMHFRKNFGFIESEKIILFASKDAAMDVEILFKAISKVVIDRKDVKFIMTGNNKVTYEIMSEKFGLKNHFTHLGLLSREDFIQVLCCADIFLLPIKDTAYNRGRWPSKIGDYTAAGRPIASNPVGEVEAIMKDNHIGILTDFNPDHYAEGLLQLLNNENVAEVYGKNARSYAESILAWDPIIDTLERCYNHAIKMNDVHNE